MTERKIFYITLPYDDNAKAEEMIQKIRDKLREARVGTEMTTQAKLDELFAKDMTPGSPWNQSSNIFTDISTEDWREYSFSGNEKVRIERPTHLCVSTSGHRILDEAGVSHYIPKGWIHLRWQVKQGQPHFVK
jgi:hypothetical protein